jgi:hypothetical protein
MIQRLFLNRVHAETAGSPIGRQDDLILPAFAHETEALLPLLEFAEPRTEVALDPAVIQLVPVLGGKSGWQIHRGFLQAVLGLIIISIRLKPTAYSVLKAGTSTGLSIDIVPSDGGSQVFGRGGEQPSSMAAMLRRQATITGQINRLLAMADLLAIDFDAR